MSEQAGSSSTGNFFEMLVRWIKLLPLDLKVLVEMIGDEELNMNARTLAVGALLYMVASIGLIPSTIPVLGYVDDVLVLHIALAIILQIDSVRADYYRTKYPETVGGIEEQIQVLTQALGALYSWLVAFIETLRQRRYKGKSAEETAQSKEAQEEIFDEAMVFAAGMNVDEATIRDRLLASPPNQLVNLLSAGLAQGRQRQEREEAKERAAALPDRGIRKLLKRGEKN